MVFERCGMGNWVREAVFYLELKVGFKFTLLIGITDCNSFPRKLGSKKSEKYCATL